MGSDRVVIDQVVNVLAVSAGDRKGKTLPLIHGKPGQVNADDTDRKARKRRRGRLRSTIRVGDRRG